MTIQKIRLGWKKIRVEMTFVVPGSVPIGRVRRGMQNLMTDYRFKSYFGAHVDRLTINARDAGHVRRDA